MRLLLSSRAQFCDSVVKNFFGWLPDKPYLSLRYRFLMGHWIDWKNPKTFTEKLQWLKVYNRKSEYTMMVDKYAVKQYVADRIGQQYIIPTLGVWDKTEDIDWDSLPEQFVLKTTHGGGSSGVVICKDKANFDRGAAVAKLEESISSDLYSALREWPYKNVPKRIIAEKFMAPVKETVLTDLPDYKFFCFNGQPEFVELYIDRFGNHKKLFCDMDWNVAGFTTANDVAKVTVEQPKEFAEMKEVAKALCEGMAFVRVDLYVHGGKVYFGEMTFHPAGGYTPITPREWEYKLGDMIKI